MKSEVTEQQSLITNEECTSLLISVYNTALEYSVSAFKRVRIVALLLAIDYSIRTNIFVSYANTFDDCTNNTTLAIIIYCSYFVSGFLSLVNGFIADAWCFDYLFCIATICDVITFWIEATATKFLILAIAYIVGGQVIQTLIYGYSSKYLPVFYTKQFQTEWMQLYTIGQLIGPIIGGILAYVIDYRAVFYTSAIISIILSIVSIVFIAGTQDKQDKKQDALTQVAVSYLDDNNPNDNDNTQNVEKNTNIDKLIFSDEYKFPLVALKLDYHHDKDISMHDNVNQDNWYKFNLILTFVIIFSISLMMMSETALCMWYIKYMNDKYNATVLFSACNLSIFVLALVLAMLLIEKICQKQYEYEKLYLLMSTIICQFITILFTFYIIPNNSFNFEYVYSFWFYLAVLGFCYGFPLMCMVLIMLEVMPKDIAGKISGLEMFVQYSIKGIGALLVGYLWQYSHEWIWYTIGCQTCISLILAIAILFALYTKTTK